MRVLLSTPNSIYVLQARQIAQHEYIGAQFSSPNRKFILLGKRLEKDWGTDRPPRFNLYRICSHQLLSEMIIDSRALPTSVEEAITDFSEQWPDIQWYIFDSQKEFFAWLGE